MFGVYVHIPFCLQRCRYCDFATYSEEQIPVNSSYVDTLVDEIFKQRKMFKKRPLDTVYFGGGTPSLLSPADIQRILQALHQNGFAISSTTEVTLEMNPATLDPQKIENLLGHGVNRISVGAQTFNNAHLKNCGRKHSAEQTRATIELLKSFQVVYSLDLLFALPGQTLAQLQEDLEIFCHYAPHHISPYCLTLPDKHPMNQNRPEEGIQTEMFSLIWRTLESTGYHRYEISNFAKPGFESQHNSLYWKDHDYWGIGLSAHSYQSRPGWGRRFWNPSDYNTYTNSVRNRPVHSSEVQAYFPKGQREELLISQSLTDYCHTFLRMTEGLCENSVRQKFGPLPFASIKPRLLALEDQGLLERKGTRWPLTEKGVLLSNLVFEKLLFLPEDIDNPPEGPIIRAHSAK